MPKFSALKKQGKPLPWQARQIIANVIEFFKREAHYGPTIAIDKYEPRAIQATGVTEKTYRNIVMEAKRIENGEILGFCTPVKSIRTTKKTINPIKAKLIRELVHNLYITENKPPTIQSLMAKIRTENIDFDGNITVLWNFMRKIGFRSTTTKTNRKTIIESYDIRYKRLRYLKQLLEYRQQNRPIVYITESYIDSAQIQEKSKKLSDKSNRLFLLHAGGESGFIPKCLLMTTAESDKNHDDARKWIENKLILNLPPHSVLIIDNATSHNIKIEEELTYNKTDMMEWLQNKNVAFDVDMTKPELSALIKTYKTQNSTYKLDELLQQYGHNVLKLPPFHPELNPMEKIWDIIKNAVITKNTTFQINNLKESVREQCDSITTNNWIQFCDDVKQMENDYMEKEGILDGITDAFEIPMEEDDDEEDDDKDNRTMDVEEVSDDDSEEISGSSKSPANFDTRPVKDEIKDPILRMLLKQETVDNDEGLTEINEWKPPVNAWSTPVKEELNSKV